MTRNQKKRTRDREEGGMSIFRLTSRETANGIFGVFSIVLSIFLMMGAFGLTRVVL